MSEHGLTVSFETKCRRCGKEYGDRAIILFSYCSNCSALMCCVSPENSAKGICDHCRPEDSIFFKMGQRAAERLEKQISENLNRTREEREWLNRRKPPLGVYPLFLWREDNPTPSADDVRSRLKAVSEAKRRYLDTQFPYPAKWDFELTYLSQLLPAIDADDPIVVQMTTESSNGK